MAAGQHCIAVFFLQCYHTCLLEQHKLFSPFHDVVTGCDCMILVYTRQQKIPWNHIIACQRLTWRSPTSIEPLEDKVTDCNRSIICVMQEIGYMTYFSWCFLPW